MRVHTAIALLMLVCAAAAVATAAADGSLLGGGAGAGDGDDCLIEKPLRFAAPLRVCNDTVDLCEALQRPPPDVRVVVGTDKIAVCGAGGTLVGCFAECAAGSSVRALQRFEAPQRCAVRCTPTSIPLSVTAICLH